MKKILAILKVKTFFIYEIIIISILMFLLTFFGVRYIHNNLQNTYNIVNTIDSNNSNTQDLILSMNKLYITDEKVFYECLYSGKCDTNTNKLLTKSENEFIFYCKRNGMNTDSVTNILNKKRALLNKIKITKVSKLPLNKFKKIDSIPQVRTTIRHKLFKKTEEKEITYKKYEKINNYELMYNISIIEKNNIKRINGYITENIKLNMELRNLANTYLIEISQHNTNVRKIGFKEIKNNIKKYENIVFILSIILSIVIIFLIYDIEKKKSKENTDKTFIREIFNKLTNKH